MEAYDLRFSGIARLYGRRAWQRFRTARVAVIGIGGVGSWAAEALARSGVQDLTLIDLDEICITNTNRQIHTLHATIGQAKVSVMAERLRAINPEIQVQCVQDFFTPATADTLLAIDYDVVIDAIDSLQNKALLIARCRERGLPLVSVGGAGGRSDPSQIRIADLSLSQNDALLRKTRRLLRSEYEFPSQGSLGVPTVFSLETPLFPGADGEVCERREAGSQARLDCDGGFGSASFVTGAFGFAAAAAALRVIAEAPKQKETETKEAGAEAEAEEEQEALPG